MASMRSLGTTHVGAALFGAIFGAGVVWASSALAHTSRPTDIQSLAQAVEPVESWPLPPFDFRPADLTFATGGQLYLADSKRLEVSRFDGQGDSLGRIDPPAGLDLRHLFLERARDDQLLVIWADHRGQGLNGRMWLEARDANGARSGELRQVQGQVLLPLPIDIARAGPERLLVLTEQAVYGLDMADLSLVDRLALDPAKGRPHRIAGLDDGRYALIRRGVQNRIEWYGPDHAALHSILPEGEAVLDLAQQGSSDLLSLERDPGGSARLRRYSAEGTLLWTSPENALADLEPILSTSGGHLAAAASSVAIGAGGGNQVARLSWREAEATARWTRDGLRGSVSELQLERGLWLAPNLPVTVDDQGRAFVLDGRGAEAELLSLEPMGRARPLGIPGLDPESDIDLHPAGDLYLSGPEDAPCRVQGALCLDLNIECACPLGGRIAVGGGPDAAGLFLSRPRLREVAVADLGLGQLAGRFQLPDALSAWPADLAALPAGAIFTADPVLGLVQRWEPDAAFTTLIRSPKLEDRPRRIAAARLDSGREILALLSADDQVRLHDAGSGAWIATLAAEDLRAGMAPLDDVALAPDGRIFLSSVEERTIHAFAPWPEGIPDPDPQPTPSPTPGQASCRIERDKRVWPTQVVLGQSAEIELSLRADCQRPGEFIGADIVLVVDNDAESRSGHGQNLRIVELQAAVAKHFAMGLDTRRHRLGLFGIGARDVVSSPLTSDVFQVIDAAAAMAPPAAFPARGTTTRDLMLLAQAQLATEGRPDALPVVIVISDGYGRRRESGPDGARDIAESMRAEGVLIFAVLTNVPAGPYVRVMESLAGSADRVLVAERPPDIEPLALRIYAMIREIAGSSLDGNLVIHDQMAPDIALAASSARPPGLEGPDWLIWRRGLLPASGITFTYTITPQRTGVLPTNAFAIADYDDVDGIRRQVVFPVPEIEVIAPSPTPSPSPMPRRDIFLPLLLREHCVSKTRGLDVALVIDASQSMSELTRAGRSKIEAAREAALAFVDLLSLERDRAALVAFNQEVAARVALSSNAGPLSAALSDLRLASGTRIHLGVDAAREILAASSDRPDSAKVMILLTDGRSNPEPVALAELAADRAKQAGQVLITIGLGTEVEQDALRRMASEPRLFFEAPDGEDLLAIYRRLAVEIPCGR